MDDEEEGRGDGLEDLIVDLVSTYRTVMLAADQEGMGLSIGGGRIVGPASGEKLGLVLLAFREQDEKAVWAALRFLIKKVGAVNKTSARGDPETIDKMSLNLLPEVGDPEVGGEDENEDQETDR